MNSIAFLKYLLSDIQSMCVCIQRKRDLIQHSMEASCLQIRFISFLVVVFLFA